MSTLVFVSGKLYYELDLRRTELGRSEFAIIRLEQLYPFPKRNVVKIIKAYKNKNKFIWAQEEPKNMGPWFHVMDHFRMMGLSLELISREESASPASGSFNRFNQRQKSIIEKVFKQ